MKAVTVYQLAEGEKDYFEDLSDLSSWFDEKRFKPCQKLDSRTMGFCDTPNGELITTLMGVTHFSVKTQEKILPACVIRQFVESRVKEISDQENRRVSRKERASIKDETIFELLPKAFVKDSVIHGFFCHDKLYIGVGTHGKAEEICSLIREATQKLPVRPVDVIDLTPIASGDTSNHIHPLEKVKLSGQKDTRVTTHKDISVESDEVSNAIASGMKVESMDISYNDQFMASINVKKQLKSLRLSDQLTDKINDEHPETKAEEWQATAIIESRAIIDFFEST